MAGGVPGRGRAGDTQRILVDRRGHEAETAQRQASERSFPFALSRGGCSLVARLERSVIRDQPVPDYAEFIIGPPHRVRPPAAPMACPGRTRWLPPGYGEISLPHRDPITPP